MPGLKSVLTEKLLLSIMIKEKKNKADLTTRPVIYLVGILPVEIRWSAGQKEKTDLMDRVEIDYSPALKNIIGLERRIRDFDRIIRQAKISELIAKMEADFNKLLTSKKLYGRSFEKIDFI